MCDLAAAAAAGITDVISQGLSEGRQTEVSSAMLI
jgi:hypothetical protein